MTPPYDPSKDPRSDEYQPRGYLHRQQPEPKITSISGAGIKIWNSLYPHVRADAKRPIAIASALILAAAVGWGAHRLGWAEGFIAGSKQCSGAGP